jgi:glycosyltransferase involved in cell wall biosynthesis
MLHNRNLQKQLVSVVIPTHNREKTIGYCLDSVLNQTYRNLEVLIVDDCSDKCSLEKTKRIIDSYNDERINIITLKEKSGAQVARNTGIKAARSDWIALLDSDDAWILDKIERQMNVVEQNGWDKLIVVHSDAVLCNVIDKTKTRFNIKRIEGENVFAELLKGPAPMFQAILTSKMAFELTGYLDENVPSYQEWDTSLKLAKICKFIYLDEPTFYYFLHEGDTISKDHRRDVEGYGYVINKYEKNIKNLCGNRVWQGHLITQYQKCVKWEIKDKRQYYFQKISFLEKCHLFYAHLRIRQRLKSISGIYYLYKVYKMFFFNRTYNDRSDNA